MLGIMHVLLYVRLCTFDAGMPTSLFGLEYSILNITQLKTKSNLHKYTQFTHQGVFNSPTKSKSK